MVQYELPIPALTPLTTSGVAGALSAGDDSPLPYFEGFDDVKGLGEQVPRLSRQKSVCVLHVHYSHCTNYLVSIIRF